MLGKGKRLTHQGREYIHGGLCLSGGIGKRVDMTEKGKFPVTDEGKRRIVRSQKARGISI